jgi:phosphatidylethanolamine/phosphatidyl-N-methylethanolamine N-methyltransferase
LGRDLDRTTIEKAYMRWAPVYDLVFDTIMATGRREAVAAAQACGPRILDVGVGTGLELPYFDPRAEVTAVDLSEAMLRKAQARVRRKAISAVKGILVMDATRLAFADDMFDAVLAPYVITVVPAPEQTLDELIRVVKPGGEIVLVNHIGAESGLMARFESWLARQTHAIGWRPEFPWARIGHWIETQAHALLIERRAVSPFGLFTLIRIRKKVPAMTAPKSQGALASA